jgi:hypothetical protein
MGNLGYYFGGRVSALLVPFPVDMSSSTAETLTSYFFFSPEASGVAGLRASIGDLVDLLLDLNVGGDLYLQWAGLSIPTYGIKTKGVALAATPWAWLRPCVRVNPGAPFNLQWLKRFSLEASAVVAIGDPLVVSGRFRWELALLWRP